jgi:uncharacterized protein
MIRNSGLWLAALLLIAGPALAQTPTAAPIPATVGTAQQIDFTSAVNGKTYRITVAKPYAFPPKGGYPVVYVLDGGAYFGTFAGAARLRSALGAELAPAIIVGISYPSESMLVAQDRRMLDLTHNAPDASMPARGVSGAPVETGGADAFYKVIETEIRPRVAAVAQVAQGKDVLFGHSLGGLFVLHTMFQHPEAFRTWLALSPSIWWTGRSVLKDETAFAAKVNSGQTSPRVFIGVGGEEQPPTVASSAEYRMVDNATELATRLQALKGAGGYQVESKVFPGQSHMSVPWEALNTMLNFALGKGSGH